MNRKSIIILILCASMLHVVTAQEPVKTTEDILNEAFEQAVEEHKNVFVIFHASWCGWCRKMDAAMQDESCKEFFDKYYVTTHLVVKESKDKKNLENPGAFDLLIKHGGESSGIPFWLIFNAKGDLLADSKMRPEGAGMDEPGQNIGCPALDEEVAAFLEKLRATSSLNDNKLDIIAERFKKNRN